MSTPLLLGLTGYSGTGKSAVSRHLVEEHGFAAFEGSELIRNAAKAEGVTLTTRDTYERFFREQQVVRGMSWIADIVLGSESPRIVQTGLRTRPDYAEHRRVGGLIIALVCPPELCIERIDASNPKNATTLEAYQANITVETSLNAFGSHTAWVIDHADVTLDTSEPLEQTLLAIDDIVASLRTR